MTARSISETDLTRRIQVHGSGEMAQLAKTFNAMMDRLQAAFTSQRNFIDDAGHELRTPITIIQGHLDLLGDLSADQAETIELVSGELERMNRMVNDLILLAKAQRPRFLHLETIDVPSFVEELFAKAKTLADRNWHLQIVGQGLMVGDRQRLTGALLNLLRNATQHTQPQDLIELGGKFSARGVEFWVRDSGVGIAVPDQQRIFDRFARSSESQSRSEGSGLGLAIVKAITEAHGGHLHLASQLGQGSTFTIILPLEPTGDLRSPPERS
jgi:signal transduction histidine kinase